MSSVAFVTLGLPLTQDGPDPDDNPVLPSVLVAPENIFGLDNGPRFSFLTAEYPVPADSFATFPFEPVSVAASWKEAYNFIESLDEDVEDSLNQPEVVLATLGNDSIASDDELVFAPDRKLSLVKPRYAQ